MITYKLRSSEHLQSSSMTSIIRPLPDVNTYMADDMDILQLQSIVWKANMRMQSSTAIIMTTLLVRGQSLTTSDPLLDLLKSPISDARCLAKCADVPTPTSQAQCYQVCKYLQDNPTSDLCKVPDLCVDFGCQIACQELSRTSDGMFDKFTREDCRLSWRMMSQDNVVYVVSGQDHSDMWSLLRGNITEDVFQMDPTLGVKYHSLTVVAVSRDQVLDVLQVKIPLYQECQDDISETHPNDNIVTGIDDLQLLAVIFLSLLVFILFVILSCILCYKRQTRSRNQHPTLNYLTRKQVQHTLMKTKIDGKKKKYEESPTGRSNYSIENTYVTSPSLTPSSHIYDNDFYSSP